MRLTWQICVNYTGATTSGSDVGPRERSRHTNQPLFAIIYPDRRDRVPRSGRKGEAMQRRFMAAALIVVVAAFTSTLVERSLRACSGAKGDQGGLYPLPAAELQDGDGTVRKRPSPSIPSPQRRVFLPGQQLRPALQAQPQGRNGERQLPGKGGRVLPESSRRQSRHEDAQTRAQVPGHWPTAPTSSTTRARPSRS